MIIASVPDTEPTINSPNENVAVVGSLSDSTNNSLLAVASSNVSSNTNAPEVVYFVNVVVGGSFSNTPKLMPDSPPF